MSKRLAFLSLIFFLVFIYPSVVFAQNNLRSGENAELAQSETINQDYLAAGRMVNIDGTVNGDVYAVGSNITLNGVVNGDFLGAGGNITINGAISGNIRIVGGNLNINGKVLRNVSVAGGNIFLSPKATVGGSFTGAGGNFNLLGGVAKTLNLAGGEMSMGGTIGGDVNAGVNRLTLLPGVKINGSVNYWSNNKANVSPQAEVLGTVTQKIPSQKWQGNYAPVDTGAKATAAGALVTFQIIGFLSNLIIGLIFLKLFPLYTGRVAETVRGRGLLSLGVGFLALAITPVAVFILLISVLGIPLAILWIFYVLLLLWLAKIFIGETLGLFLNKQLNLNWNRYVVFFVGLLIYYVIGFIPIIGFIFKLLVTLAGIGAMIMIKKEYYTELNKKKLI